MEIETHTKTQTYREGDVKTEAETGVNNSTPRNKEDASSQGRDTEWILPQSLQKEQILLAP